LILIDAHGLIFQVFHAIRDRMTGPSGVPTNALFGFTRDLLFLRSQKPEYLVCAYDCTEHTFRNDLAPDYKAHRDPMPDDLSVQIPLIHKALAALGVPTVTHHHYEADDVLATVAAAAEKRGLDVWICSSDKDCRQLITDRVRMFNLRKRAEFGKKELLDDWGVAPEQVVDLQTLVGDSVDNVKGVPGIGIKTGAKLLQEFGTLDNLLGRLAEVPGKKGESIQASLPYLETTRKLVRLATDVPIDLKWDEWRLQPINNAQVQAFFQEWGFHTLLRQFRETSSNPVSGPRQGTLFSDDLFVGSENTSPNGDGTSTVPPSGWQATYHLVDTAARFEDFFSELAKQKRFAFDLETTGLEPLRCEIVGYAFCWKQGEAWYLPVRGPDSDPRLDPHATLQRLKPLLEDLAIEKVNQNVKYDLLVLRAHDVRTAGVAGDPMVADYLLHAGERSHSLEDLARRYLNHQVIPITDLIGKKTRKQPSLRMDQVPTRQVATYAGEDADVAWRLCELLEPRLESLGRAPGLAPLRKLYGELEVPLIDVLAEMEFNGIRLDVSLLERLGQDMASQLATIEKEIYTLAGETFNIGSLPQLRRILFEKLKLPSQRKTGVTGAASTDQESLEKLAALTHLPGHELPRKILEHRQVAKLKSTYVDALPAMVHPRDGRIHASFNQTVAATGRLSSSDPNLQNIPVRREMGQQIRQAFVPEPGWKLLTADYSQIELRLLAHFSGDDTLRKAFTEDRDVHAAVAAQIHGVDVKEVTDPMRRVAKTVNFGVIYGISHVGLSERLGISRDEASKFIGSYFARYPKVLDYQQQLLEKCRKTGYVTTILGRQRQFDRQAIRANSTYQSRNQAEREAINMEIQGSAADLIKMAMLNLYRLLHERRFQSRMLLQIHDELVFETPPEELNLLADLVRTEMTAPLQSALRLEVSLKVDLAAGPNWLDVEEKS
jgi:DNA polymerase I